ncbi:hypothetical protein Q31b_49200 [Novipirellula aureliae]|uniref:Uncharacterized protein n=1 Tax=Novipirellula aureliae TaxID=2527966 RepID=A0A5C6DPB2_9BACT|nr:hypothetical protein Q31b_49200 [Novipirellula aureliae]
MRSHAKSRGGRTRTRDKGIMSHTETIENTGKNDTSEGVVSLVYPRNKDEVELLVLFQSMHGAARDEVLALARRLESRIASEEQTNA